MVGAYEGEVARVGVVEEAVLFVFFYGRGSVS